MAFHYTLTIVSGPLLYNAVIKTKRLWILLYLLAGFVENGRGGITNLLLLPSESAGGGWNLMVLKGSGMTDTRDLLDDQLPLGINLLKQLNKLFLRCWQFY